MKKKVDARVRTLIENGVVLKQRSMFVIVGDRGRDQVVNLHFMLSKTRVRRRPSVLWCYKRELGFTTHQRKRMKQIKREVQRGTRDANESDPFELFLTCTDIRYSYYKDTHKVLGQTFGVCVLQDFEALTPNLMARTVETVEGGGLVILLLKTMTSLKQLYSMTMDVHARYRTESHRDVAGRFNERFMLSLGSCERCLVVDDELNVLPISSHVRHIQPVDGLGRDEDAFESASEQALQELKSSLKNTLPVGSLVNAARTIDQAKAIMTFVDAVSEKSVRSVVSMTAARGRGKSAALGFAVAGAIAFGFANIFVTAPSPENLKTLFEMVFRGFDALGYKEHLDYEILQAKSVELKNTVVRVNVFRQHRQTIQYIVPSDSVRLSQAELLVIDEAAAIPLPLVKSLLGSYLVFMSSTINGYEGTGRSLSLKLLHQLRKQSAIATPSSKDAIISNTLRELVLNEPIRYAPNDPVEAWLNNLLCLDCSNPSNLSLNVGAPHPSQCELFYVNRDTLFSYHHASEAFLQRMMALYVSSHYKNSPNDLQLMSDAPAHQLFVLLGPLSSESVMPDILAVIQIALEGEISQATIAKSLSRGQRASGDLIPWTISQQFQDKTFASLCGARIVRIAVHPDLQGMGYGSRALEQLCMYYQGDMAGDADITSLATKTISTTNDDDDDDDKSLCDEKLTPRTNLAPILERLEDRPAEHLHYIGSSFGVTQKLFNFWRRNSFAPLYMRQTANDLTGEHSMIALKALAGNALNSVADAKWVDSFSADFQRRFLALSSFDFAKLPVALALSIADPNSALIATTQTDTESLVSNQLLFTLEDLEREFLEFDLRRLESYSRNLVDYHMVLDLVPAIARLALLGRLPVRCSYTQAALLVGIGLQHKTVTTLEVELGIQSNQILALFNKVVRKVSGFFTGLIEKRARNDIPATTNENVANDMVPLRQTLENDLKEGEKQARQAIRTQQDELVASLHLDEYSIKGTDEDWSKALPSVSGAKTLQRLSVKGESGKKKKHSSKRLRDAVEGKLKKTTDAKNKRVSKKKLKSKHQ